MVEALQAVLAADPRIAYALMFGSQATGMSRSDSDVDVAIGLMPSARLETLDIGRLTSMLETAAEKRVDLVLLDEAPPGLAYRIFQSGQPILVRDERVLNGRRASAILEYLDFRPIEELCARGVLGSDGR